MFFKWQGELRTGGGAKFMSKQWPTFHASSSCQTQSRGVRGFLDIGLRSLRPSQVELCQDCKTLEVKTVRNLMIVLISSKHYIKKIIQTHS